MRFGTGVWIETHIVGWSIIDSLIVIDYLGGDVTWVSEWIVDRQGAAINDPQ
ncbi:MAG: hypothetical protein ABJB34_04540 [Acidobacteriota bacterium]